MGNHTSRLKRVWAAEDACRKLIRGDEFDIRAFQALGIDPEEISRFLISMLNGGVTVGDLCDLREDRCVPHDSLRGLRLTRFLNTGCMERVYPFAKWPPGDRERHIFVLDPLRMAQATRGRMKFKSSDLEMLEKIPFSDELLASIKAGDEALMFCVPESQAVTLNTMLDWFGDDVRRSSPAINGGYFRKFGECMANIWNKPLRPGWHLLVSSWCNGMSELAKNSVYVDNTYREGLDRMLSQERGPESWASTAQTAMYLLLKCRIHNGVPKDLKQSWFLSSERIHSTQSGTCAHIDMPRENQFTVSILPLSRVGIDDYCNCERALVSHDPSV